MPTFNKFPSVSGFNQAWLDTYILPYYGDMQAYVTEKIHGKSLTVEHDGAAFLYGRRKDYIQKGDKFGDLDYIKPHIEKALARMHTEMSEIIEEHYKAADHAKEKGLEDVVYPNIPRGFKKITLRGEFFGGHYNHPDVPQVTNMSHVKSSGISYSQELSYSVYRIEVDDVVLPMHDMGMLCLTFGIPHVPLLYTGSLKECLEWSREHNSEPTTIPSGCPLLTADGTPVTVTVHDEQAYKSLPIIEGNEREGNVIAMVEPVVLPSGKSLIIKDKNPKHLETKYDKTPKPVVNPLEGSVGTLHDDLLPMLTISRLHNVQSHNTEFEQSEFRKAVGLVVQDAIDEYMLEASPNSIIWVGLTTHERKTLTKLLNASCADRLREAFFSNK